MSKQYLKSLGFRLAVSASRPASAHFLQPLQCKGLVGFFKL